jgi:hypothetical protein
VNYLLLTTIENKIKNSLISYILGLAKMRMIMFVKLERIGNTSFKAVWRVSDEVIPKTGRAIAQAVSRWLPTATARVQTRV